MSSYIQSTLNGESVTIVDVDCVGGDTYIAFIDSSSNLKTIKLQYQHNTSFSTSATVTDSVSASVGTLTTNFNNLSTYVGKISGSVSADSSNRTIFMKGEISPIKLISSNYSVTTNDYTILSSATPVSGNTLSITLFSISAQDGAIIEIKKIDTSINDTWVSAASNTETLDGVTSIALSVPYTSRRFKSFGGKWYIF